jgi:hypothetical protein
VPKLKMKPLGKTPYGKLCKGNIRIVGLVLFFGKDGRGSLQFGV